MLETAIALTLAHLIADFVLQTDAMVRDKRKPTVLALHMTIVAGISWLALGLAPLPELILGLGLAHGAIDWIKARHGKGFQGFAIDQAAHLAIILVAAKLIPQAYEAGLWGRPALADWTGFLPRAMTLAAGLLAAVWAGGHAVRLLMSNLATPDDSSLPGGGKLIGRLERVLILGMVLAGQPDGIGFLITAKSILRFGEVSREGATGGRGISEYVIIGTLASFGWAWAVAYCTGQVLNALPNP